MSRKVIVTLKISPESVDVQLIDKLEEFKKIIESFGGQFYEYKEIPVAFGLKNLEIRFIVPDAEFKEEELIEKIQSVEGVQSAEVTNVTLASM